MVFTEVGPNLIVLLYLLLFDKVSVSESQFLYWLDENVPGQSEGFERTGLMPERRREEQRGGIRWMD